MSKVALIGLDAVEGSVADQFIKEGLMPNLKALRERSAGFGLTSESNWRSGRVWETLLSGVADFPSAALFDPATYQSKHVGARRKQPFYADVEGVNVLAIDVPYMSLSNDVPGIQVVWGGHDAGYPRASRPRGVLSEIDRKFGVHPAFLNDFSCPWYDAASIDTLTEALIEGSRKRIEIIEWLMEQDPDWSLFMTVLSEAHSAGEVFWHGLAPSDHPMAQTKTASHARKRLRDVFAAVDEAVGRLVDLLPEDTIIVVTTVHGMTVNDVDLPSMVLLPELLYRSHFKRPRLHGQHPWLWALRGKKPVEPGPYYRWGQYLRKRVDRSAWALLAEDVKASVGLLKRPETPISRLGVPIPPEDERAAEEIGEPEYGLAWQVPCWYADDWPKMPAFALPSFYDGRVRINVAGRDGNGVVAPENYARVCDEVCATLEACRDGRTGKPAVRHIERLRGDDPFALKDLDGDLIITWQTGIDALRHPELGLVGPVAFRRTGGHTDHGFADISGPGVKAGVLPDREATALTALLREYLAADKVQKRAHMGT